MKIRSFPMLFNGRMLIFTFSRTQVRIAEHERLQSLFKMSMVHANRSPFANGYKKNELAKRKSSTFATLAKPKIPHTTKIYFSYWTTGIWYKTIRIFTIYTIILLMDTVTHRTSPLWRLFVVFTGRVLSRSLCQMS